MALGTPVGTSLHAAERPAPRMLGAQALCVFFFTVARTVVRAVSMEDDSLKSIAITSKATRSDRI